MIYVGTIIKNPDNSGAKKSKCINMPRLLRSSGARAGQKIVLLVKVVIRKRHIKKKSKIILRGQICRGVIVRHRSFIKRKGNFLVKAATNNVILVNEYTLPYATRIFGPIFHEVRQKLQYKKIISLAKRLI